ncbi:MAG TPA: hypothetical protein VH349_03730 [Ktedonobacterales bacterium]
MDSPELQSIEAFVATMRRVLDDVMARPVRYSTSEVAPDASAPQSTLSLNVTSFRQTWPDASCGFGGIAAQVLTDAQTVVVSAPDGALALVYVRGEFAYLVERPNQAFWDAVRDRQLPGAAADHTHLGD